MNEQSENKQTQEQEDAALAIGSVPATSVYKHVRITSDDDPAIPPLWLITFTDIMALMLTFFVLMYSMAMPEKERWSEMTAAINKNFNSETAPSFKEGSQMSIVIDKIEVNKAQDLGYLESIVRKALADNENTRDVLIFAQQDRLVVSMPNDLFFDSGASDIQADGKRILFELGGILQRIKNAIEIVGHADPRPIESETGPYTDNWDLSMARAMAVSSVLNNVGYTKPHTVRAMSSARYNDLPQDMEREKKLALSRRVDIVILNTDTKQKSFLGIKL